MDAQGRFASVRSRAAPVRCDMLSIGEQRLRAQDLAPGGRRARHEHDRPADADPSPRSSAR